MSTKFGGNVAFSKKINGKSPHIFFIDMAWQKRQPLRKKCLTSSPYVGLGPQDIRLSSAATTILLLLKKVENIEKHKN